MAYILGEPTVQQYFDVNGDPLASGTIEFYLSGTSTPTPIYSDSSGTSLGTSVTLNSIGAPQSSGGTAVALFFDTGVTYKIVRKDSAGTPIAPTIDPFYPIGDGSRVTYDSFALAYAASNTGIDTIYTISFLDGWADTLAGPLGGALYHRDGTAGTASTAYSGNKGFYDANGDGFSLSTDQIVTPYHFGYNLDAADMTTPTIVSNNWNAMKAYFDFVAANDARTIKFEATWSSESIFAEWAAGRSAPIGIYSDSTSDGFGTTGHVASTGADSPFAVTITESAAAWPKRFQAIMQTSVYDSSIPARCYNGGFDAQSFVNGFGLKHWYNTWFRGLSGSNIDFSDVKMILIGFGASDSINADNLAGVIDAYETDLECVIVDALLRGVQPALMMPVLTTQNTGTGVSGRKGWQSVSAIGAIQRKLADKYNLEVFSFGESWRKVISHFHGHDFRSFMQPDMIHPSDAGHNMHASYMATKFNKNIEMLGEGEKVNSLFAGHPCYNTDPDDVIAPSSSGGTILKYVPNLSGISDEAYIYSWLASEGNGKPASDWLASCTVYVDKPTALLLKDVDSNRTDKDITIQSYFLGSNATPAPLWQSTDQPDNTFYSHKSFVTLLPPGANVIYVNASNDSTDQAFGGLYLVDLDEVGFNYDRGTNLAKCLDYPDVLNPYTPQARPSKNLGGYYNCADESFMSLSFTIATALSSGSAYFVRTHFNDLAANKDSYNVFEFNNNDFNIKVVNTGVSSTLFNTTVAGLNALLVSGAQVEIKMRSRFGSSLGFNVQLFVDGVVRDSQTCVLGDAWTDGYGFDTDIRCRNVQIVSSVPQTGFADLNNTI